MDKIVDLIQPVLVVLGVYFAMVKATAGIQKSVDRLTQEVGDLIKTVTRIDATYVTEEECAARRAACPCKEK